MKVDRVDARIIAALQRDGRRSVVELAEEVGLSGTPCARRIRLLEQAGVIQGYTAIVSPERLGLNVHAFIEVKLGDHIDLELSLSLTQRELPGPDPTAVDPADFEQQSRLSFAEPLSISGNLSLNIHWDPTNGVRNDRLQSI